jgi:hypothetical protein
MPRRHDPREIPDILSLDEIEKARDHPERHEPGIEGGRIVRPPRNDPRHSDQSVLPGQVDIPAGSTTGGKRRGGNRRPPA